MVPPGPPATPLPPTVPPGPAGWTSYGPLPTTPPTAPPPGPSPTVAPGWSTAPAYGGAAPGTGSGRGSRSAAVGVIVVVILLVALGAIGVYAVLGSGGAKATAGPSAVAGASASASPAAGIVVFSDDFHDPGSGWSTGSLPSGTTFSYTSHGFEVHAVGSLHHITSAPYGRARQRIAVAATATQSSPAPDAAGFGVTCDRGTDADEIRYEFIAYSDATWSIERLDGPLSATSGAPDVLKQGALSTKPGAAPMTVEGTCVSQPDALSTRLTLVVDGVTLAELTDTATTLPGSGWYAELLVSSDDPPTTVTVTKFEVRTVP